MLHSSQNHSLAELNPKHCGGTLEKLIHRDRQQKYQFNYLPSSLKNKLKQYQKKATAPQELEQQEKKYRNKLNQLFTDSIQAKSNIVLNHDTLVAISEQSAAEYADIINVLGKEQGYEFAYKSISKIGLNPPSELEYGLQQAINRMICPIWWRKNLRKVFAMKYENLQRQEGNTHAKNGIYVSNDTYQRWGLQQERNNHLISLMQGVNNDTGEVLSLKALIDSSVSNPVNRRNELTIRLKGCEKYAQYSAMVGMFYTLTCPSAYHRQIYYKANKSKNLRAKVVDNPNYQGHTPKEGGAYLQDIWARARAKFKRDNVHIMGFRVIEPHHDGTPHWHIMLFCNPQHKDYITNTLRAYNLEQSPNERGADRYRFKAVEIDWSRGSACGYIAKYIAKAIDGFAVEYDLYGKCAKDGAKRIKAWASTHGFKQFNAFGLPPVGIWRQLRKVASMQNENLIPYRFRDILTYADQGDYFKFLVEYKALDGSITLLKQEPTTNTKKLSEAQLQLEELGFKYPDIEKSKKTIYGDELKHKTVGLIFGAWESVITTAHDWTIRRIEAISSEIRSAWTCVNNCTQTFREFTQQTDHYHHLGYANYG